VTARLPEGGEARPGQHRMAEAVARAIASSRHLVVSAGTGTGKSMAYLVPAILSRQRTVVATATKTLQDQLATNDLPFLRRHLGVPFSFALVKGRSNYLCRQRAVEVAGDGAQGSFDELGQEDTGPLGHDIRRLLAWAERSDTGDRSELPFEPRPSAWAMLSVGPTDCPGRANCPSGDECFAEAARDRAAAADVIVVNTHLYVAHLASGGAVLPPHDVVVFDEAHEVEDVATEGLGVELGPFRFRALGRRARTLLRGEGAEAGASLEEAGDLWQATLSPLAGRRLPAALLPPLIDALDVVERRLSLVISALRQTTDPEHQAASVRTMQAAGHLAADLATVRGADVDRAVWVEEQGSGPGGRAAVLRVAPIEVGPILAEACWPQVKAAILTSATIPPGLPVRLGLPLERSEQLEVGSPFPFATHALLYCAVKLPDPRRAAASAAAIHEELGRLIEAAGGRTLALFTSWRAMQEAATALRKRLPFRILAQGELPKPALVEAFAAEESACLFATMGFWQGLDVPGPTLSLVTIDRVPFPRPDDPLFEARRERAGPAAFRSVDLPRAATLLAQGAGRLIRSSRDRGVVAVLDPRLATASYRWDLVRALPPMTRTRHRSEAEAFLRGVAVRPEPAGGRRATQ
jgi:ATP-dependent DNA helicase DinG